VATYYGFATGNSTEGIFQLGYETGAIVITTRDLYTYVGDVVTAATAASAASCRRRRHIKR